MRFMEPSVLIGTRLEDRHTIARLLDAGYADLPRIYAVCLRSTTLEDMVFVLDNYDSFTYNLVQYLGELGAEVEVCGMMKLPWNRLRR